MCKINGFSLKSWVTHPFSIPHAIADNITSKKADKKYKQQMNALQGQINTAKTPDKGYQENLTPMKVPTKVQNTINSSPYLQPSLNLGGY